MSMGIDGVPVVGFDDDEVARHRSQVYRLIGIDRPGILEKDGVVLEEVDGIPLRPTILSTNYNPVRSRENGPPPSITIPQANSQDEVVE